MFNEFEDIMFFPMEPDEICEEEFSEEECSEEEFMISQQQGNWLDGYLDAMDEMEEILDE